MKEKVNIVIKRMKEIAMKNNKKHKTSISNV